ncbi:diguanylate cyclase [Thiocapsa sp.]|uniref:diguanylate cyclase domain-containing protein n=1 Tax=Thiocapsa sp. TaxID=2024551 RepID=UPI0025D6168E|nr:diguanylate cyclase [Thiocapsa sp.]
MRLSEFIICDLEAILQEWECFAASLLEPDQMMDKRALRDHARKILEAVAADLTEPQTERAETAKSKGKNDLPTNNDAASISHGKERLALGFSLNATIAEYRALRASVIRRWQKSLLGDPVSDTEIGDVIRFNEAIDQSISHSATSYSFEKEQQARVFDSILSFSPDLTFTFTLDGRFAYVNKATTDLFAHPSDQLVGKRFNEIDLPNGIELQQHVDLVILTKKQCRGEMCYPSHSGHSEFYEYLFVPIIYQDGTVEAVIGTAHNITERKAKEDESWHKANHDQLTGLPNRRMFLERLEQDIKNSGQLGSSTALLFIDIDYFKEVNDRLGHDAGDLLLRFIADRLRSSIREADSVARLGGDEFCVILRDFINTTAVELVAENILTALASPFQVLNNFIHLSASVGIAFSPQDACTTEDLIRKADQAMYTAKSAGRNRYRCFYS